MRAFDRLAIIVVNYGSSDLLEENLAPLALAARGATTIVVDSFTTAEERDRVIKRSQGRWQTVLPSHNPGFGSGMNLGVAAAKEFGADHFLLLNPDATLQPDQLEQLLLYSLNDPMALISPRIVRPDGSTWSAGSDLYLADGRMRSQARRLPGAAVQPWLSGACLLTSSVVWDLIGGFRDNYFLYWEDVDLSLRVEDAGGKLVLLSDAVAVHAEGGTQGAGHEQSGGAKSNAYYRFNIRNRMMYAALNLDTKTLRSWRRSIVPVGYEILMQGGRRQLIRSPMPFVSAMKGVIEAYSLAHQELLRRKSSQ